MYNEHKKTSIVRKVFNDTFGRHGFVPHLNVCTSAIDEYEFTTITITSYVSVKMQIQTPIPMTIRKQRLISMLLLIKYMKIQIQMPIPMEIRKQRLISMLWIEILFPED